MSRGLYTVPDEHLPKAVKISLSDDRQTTTTSTSFHTALAAMSASAALRCHDRCVVADRGPPSSPSRISVVHVTVVCWLIMAAVTTTSGAVNLHLDGSAGSHARLSGWIPCVSTVVGHVISGNDSVAASLSFEFQTRRSNSLLLYVDRRAPSSSPKAHTTSDSDVVIDRSVSQGAWLVELRMVRGGLWLRAERGVILAVGGGLDDGRTHAVTVSRSSQSIQLTVDRSTQSASLPTVSKASNFSGFASTPPEIGRQPDEMSYFTFIGGLPIEYSTNGELISRLAAPSAAFEPRFVGWIRRLTYSATGCNRTTAGARTLSGGMMGTARTAVGSSGSSSFGRLAEEFADDVRLLSGSGLRSNVDESCSEYDPCQNGATCLSTDLGPVCDCSSIEYTGALCDKGQQSSYVMYTFRLLITINYLRACR